MPRVLVLVLVLACAAPLAADSPDYSAVAASPSTYAQKSDLRFHMVFNGLEDVDAVFAPLGRNASTHVQLVTPRGGTVLPVFLSRSKSKWLRKLRESSTGVEYELVGAIKSFRTPAFTAEGLQAAEASGAKVGKQQAAALWRYYRGSSTVAAKGGPDQWAHYLVDITSVRKSKTSDDDESSSSDSSTEDGSSTGPGPPGPPGSGSRRPQGTPGSSGGSTTSSGYQSVTPMQLVRQAQSLLGKPVKISFPFMGLLGKMGSNPQLSAVMKQFSRPQTSFLKGSPLLSGGDPAQALKMIQAPGPLANKIAIAYGSNWDVAKMLGSLQNGSTVELQGVLVKAAKGAGGPQQIFVLEGVKKGRGGGGGRRPGPGMGSGPRR